MNYKHLGVTACLLVVSLAMAHTAAAQNADNRPLIRHVFVDLDTEMLFIKGTRFGETPVFALFGLPNGSIVRLVTPFWSNTAITAVLPTSEPGNYKLVIITGTNKRDQMGVTIGAVGVTGDRGPTGPMGTAGAGLPSGCGSGQVAAWNGATWVCADVATTGGTQGCIGEHQFTFSLSRGPDDDPWFCINGGGLTVLVRECPLGGICDPTVLVDDIILRGLIPADSRSRESVDSMQIEAGLDDFALRELTLSDLVIPAEPGERAGEFIPGVPGPVTIIADGIVADGANTNAATWFALSSEGSGERDVVVNLVDGREPLNPLVSYEFRNCVLLSYQTVPFVSQFVESLRIQCPLMISFQSDFRRGMAQWFTDLINGVQPIEEDLAVSFLDRSGNIVQTHLYFEAFPITYRFPSFDATRENRFDEEVVIKANGRETQ